MMHCMVVWKTRISGFIHLSYKFTPIILGIRWSGDLTDSENIYSIKQESTYISWGRGSWNRCCCCSVTKLCLTLCDPMDCSLPGSSFHGILQERILEWAAIPFLTQGSNSHLLHWQVDSLPLSHRGSPQASASLNSFSLSNSKNWRKN